MVPPGLEPGTLRLLAVRSNQLSYRTHVSNAMCGQQLILMTIAPQLQPYLKTSPAALFGNNTVCAANAGRQDGSFPLTVS